MERAIADTGFIVSLTNRLDSKHEEVKKIYYEHNKIIMPQTVLAEVAYLIGRESGIETVSEFLKGLPSSKFLLTALTEEDISKTADILKKYIDSRIDFVDASVMSIAERLNIRIILTLDRRDFGLFRPTHCEAFTLRP